MAIAKKRKHIHKGKNKPLGKRWKKVIGDALMKETRRIGQQHVKTLDKEGKGKVVIGIPVTLFVEYGRKGRQLARNGRATCGCFMTDDVCICYGQCPPDACDEKGPIFTKG